MKHESGCQVGQVNLINCLCKLPVPLKTQANFTFLFYFWDFSCIPGWPWTPDPLHPAHHTPHSGFISPLPCSSPCPVTSSMTLPYRSSPMLLFQAQILSTDECSQEMVCFHRPPLWLPLTLLYSSNIWFFHILFSERLSLIFRFNLLFSPTGIKRCYFATESNNRINAVSTKSMSIRFNAKIPKT